MKRVLVSILIFTFCFFAWAHGGHDENEPGINAKTASTAPIVTEVLSHANYDYQAHIKSIFQSKCMDCHSRYTQYPWYHQIPLVRRYIDSDIAKAREHLDISDDFPFRGHGTVSDDLTAIVHDTQAGTMPPWNYRLMHHGTALTAHEKELVANWATQTLQSLHQAGLH